MSRAHPADRAILGLIGLMTVSVPIGATLHFLFPMTTRRLWVGFWNAVHDAVVLFFHFVDETIPPEIIGILILGIMGIIALGFVFVVYENVKKALVR